MRLSAEQIDALHSMVLMAENDVPERLHWARQYSSPTELQTPEAPKTARSGLVAVPVYRGER